MPPIRSVCLASFLIFLSVLVGCGSDGGGNPVVTFDAPMVSTRDAPTTTRPDAQVETQPDAPQLDDAGCPVPGPIPPLAEAGFPTDGLVLWLRADHGVATTDGNLVCRWDDQSGQSHDFRPTATPPVLAPTSLRNEPAVSFIGNHEMSRGDVLGIDAAAGRTIAVFGMATDTATRFHYVIQGQVGTAGTYFGLDQNTFNSAGGLEGVYVTNNAYDSNMVTTGDPHAHILSISSFTPGGTLPGVLVYTIDGAATSLTRTPGGTGDGTVENFSTADFTAIGSTGDPFTGALLGEVIVWNRALDETERAMVVAHFQARYPPPDVGNLR